jgi:hypothetical protein
MAKNQMAKWPNEGGGKGSGGSEALRHQAEKAVSRSDSFPRSLDPLSLDPSAIVDAQSVVYSGIFGSVLASIPALKTHVVTFDTSIADLTENLADPVDILMGVQLGGGTDINRALAYCQTLITRPRDTILVLITDLYEGGDAKEMLKRAAAITAAGTRMVTLLALGDDGAPIFDEHHAAAFAAAPINVPSFACTPDLFPDLMAAAIQGRDLGTWAATQGLLTTRAHDG